MYNVKQFRDLIQRVLKDLEDHTRGKIPYSDEAVELLLMTAAHESHLGIYLRQVEGPALSPFQLEPETFYDMIENFIDYREWLQYAVTVMCPESADINESHEELEWNLKLAIVFCRIHYYRVPYPLPKEPEAMAAYAKQFYNTMEGKAKAEDYLNAYETLVLTN